MTDPIVRCTYCNASRDPQHHMGGRGHPVDKAEKWILNRCKVLGMKCNFVYRAGMRGALTEESRDFDETEKGAGHD